MNFQFKKPMRIFYFNRWIAFTLCLALITPNGFASVVTHSPSRSKNTTANVLIPSEVGTVEESFESKSGKTVIYIQDAHVSLEAQENIAKAITHLIKDNGIKTVFEEGYEGIVPTDKYFSFIKDSVLKETVSYFLMDKLRIGGAEFAHINRKQDFNLIGVDQLNLHRQNIEWYRRNAANKEQTDRQLVILQKEMDSLANRYFPKTLKDWMRLRARFDEQKLDMLSYLRRTNDIFLKQTAKDSFVASFPTIDALLKAEGGKAKQVKEIAPAQLFREMDQLENRIANVALSQARDQRIFQYHKTLGLLQRLNAIELSLAEFGLVNESLAGFDLQTVANFIAENGKKSIVLSKDWQTDLENAIHFYQTALERDHSIEGHLEQFLNSKENTAVLVFGGFHKDGIKEMLKKHDISYQVIMPKMGSIDARHQAYYKRLMGNGNLPFEIPANVTLASRNESDFQRWDVLGLFVAKSELRVIADVIQRSPNKDWSLLNHQIEVNLMALKNSYTQQGRAEVRSGADRAKAQGLIQQYDGIWERYDEVDMQVDHTRGLNEIERQRKAREGFLGQESDAVKGQMRVLLPRLRKDTQAAQVVSEIEAILARSEVRATIGTITFGDKAGQREIALTTLDARNSQNNQYYETPSVGFYQKSNQYRMVKVASDASLQEFARAHRVESPMTAGVIFFNFSSIENAIFSTTPVGILFETEQMRIFIPFYVPENVLNKSDLNTDVRDGFPISGKRFKTVPSRFEYKRTSRNLWLISVVAPRRAEVRSGADRAKAQGLIQQYDGIWERYDEVDMQVDHTRGLNEIERQRKAREGFLGQESDAVKGQMRVLLPRLRKDTQAAQVVSEIEAILARSEVGSQTAELDVTAALNSLSTPSMVYLDFEDFVQRFSESQREELFALAYEYAEKVRIVIYNADLTAEMLKLFRELKQTKGNVWITAEDAQKAFQATQKGFVKNFALKANIQLSKAHERLKEQYGDAQAKIHFFRYKPEDHQSGLLAAALLWADYNDAGRVLEGIGRDNEGYLTFVGEVLRNLIQRSEARRVVAMAA